MMIKKKEKENWNTLPTENRICSLDKTLKKGPLRHHLPPFSPQSRKTKWAKGKKRGKMTNPPPPPSSLLVGESKTLLLLLRCDRTTLLNPPLLFLQIQPLLLQRILHLLMLSIQLGL